MACVAIRFANRPVALRLNSSPFASSAICIFDMRIEILHEFDEVSYGTEMDIGCIIPLIWECFCDGHSALGCQI